MLCRRPSGARIVNASLIGIAKPWFPEPPRFVGSERVALPVRTRCRGVDADDLSGAVDERAARVARLDIGVDLDEAGQLLAGARRVRRLR